MYLVAWTDFSVSVLLSLMTVVQPNKCNLRNQVQIQCALIIFVADQIFQNV